MTPENVPQWMSSTTRDTTRSIAMSCRSARSMSFRGSLTSSNTTPRKTAKPVRNIPASLKRLRVDRRCRRCARRASALELGLKDAQERRAFGSGAAHQVFGCGDRGINGCGKLGGDHDDVHCMLLSGRVEL